MIITPLLIQGYAKSTYRYWHTYRQEKILKKWTYFTCDRVTSDVLWWWFRIAPVVGSLLGKPTLPFCTIVASSPIYSSKTHQYYY